MEEKILVVDDESAISDIIKFNFEKEGYLINTADNGKGAIKLAGENDYDLILLDIMTVSYTHLTLPTILLV